MQTKGKGFGVFVVSGLVMTCILVQMPLIMKISVSMNKKNIRNYQYTSKL